MSERRYIVAIYQDIADKLIRPKNSKDLIALYFFYNLVANRQHTNCIRATSNYCRKTLKMGQDRFFKANKDLQEMELIKIFKRGKGNHWYIELLDRVWKQSTKINDDLY